MDKRYRVGGGRRASFCPDSLIAHLLSDLLAYSKVTWLVHGRAESKISVSCAVVHVDLGSCHDSPLMVCVRKESNYCQ